MCHFFRFDRRRGINRRIMQFKRSSICNIRNTWHKIFTNTSNVTRGSSGWNMETFGKRRFHSSTGTC